MIAVLADDGYEVFDMLSAIRVRPMAPPITDISDDDGSGRDKGQGVGQRRKIAPPSTGTSVGDAAGASASSGTVGTVSVGMPVAPVGDPIQLMIWRPSDLSSWPWHRRGFMGHS